METKGFLTEIDDENIYARELETAWVLLGIELQGILTRFPLVAGRPANYVPLEGAPSLLKELDGTYKDLATMSHTMSLLARDISDRRRRLADVAVGLTDRVLDVDSP